MTYKHWQLTRDADGIAWATLDKADASTNVLSAEVMAELAGVLDECDRQPPRALIFRSGKAAGFIAGADIGEFDMIATAAGVRELVERGWNLYNRLAAVPYVTLALVRGHCMGGGTELALACRIILVVDEPGTKMALPEVMLGIIPGWGGMLRLPRRVGAPAALDMMLTGKAIDARRAKRMGLADECVPPRVMEAAARMLALEPPPRRRLPLVQRLLAGPLRSIVATKARKQVASRARPEHYPAPYAIIDMWARHGGNALDAPELLDVIARNPAAKNLVRVFRLQDRLKGFGKSDGQSGNFQPKRVHVVGAGTMGGDIAAWCAQRGMTVTLQDQDINRIAPAIARAAADLKRRRRDKAEIRAVMDRLIPDPAGHGVAHADVVIEAIFENLEAKHALFRTIEPRMKADAVLASNTSSLRIEDLRTVLERPERLVGIHYFNPVAKMPLVEVVAAGNADEAMVKRACAFVRKIDKLPLPVKSAPGFLVNAVLAPYLHEAMHCVDEGIAPAVVDAAALAFGMPMGPIELIDTVGLDIALAAGKQLSGASDPPRCLADHVTRGELGKKSGQGFYRWENGKISGKSKKVGAGNTAPGLAERLMKPLIARTAALVEEGVVADADLADAGVIFGTGFAPFTGGPLNYLRAARGDAA